MAKSLESLVSFNAGEFSPSLTSRVDQQKYRSSCIQMRNMLALKTGPSTRRPGTQYIATGKQQLPFSDLAVRLQDFQFSIDTAFIWEFGQNYIRFYSNGAQVILSSAPAWVPNQPYLAGAFVEDPGDSNNIYYCFSAVTGTTEPHNDTAHWTPQTIYEVWTPYDATVGAGGLAATEVFQLQFCEINDVTYITHPNHPRYKLVRLGDTNWTMTAVADDVPALLDQNATDTTISADNVTGQTNLAASAPGWFTGIFYDVGSSVLENYTGSDVIYNCIVPHVSGVFGNDFLAGYWEAQTIFQPGHVGAYWQLAYLRDSAYVEYDGTAASGFAAGTSTVITAFGDWEVHTYGVWSADIAVQASADGQNWQTVRTVTGRNDRNVDITGTAVEPQMYRLVITNVAVPITPGATNPRVVFECDDAFLYGLVQITNVYDPLHATARVVTPLPLATPWISGNGYNVGDRVSYNNGNYICVTANPDSTVTPDMDPATWLADGYPTIYWSEGAWSAVRGYPAAIIAFEQKVWCGFTEFEPQRVWGTQTDDIENWSLGDQTEATDGVAFDLDAVGDGAILWMQAQDSLFVGMVSAEWVISSSDSTSAISPTNVAAHRQSKWGSNPNIPARVVGDALVFTQRQAFSMRQMLYSVVTNKYMSQDLTALSDQILNLGALQTAYQKQGQKNGVVWATTANGELVGLTYELDQEVFGWHRHFTGPGGNDFFESVATIQGQGTNDDEVWVVVRRQLGAAQLRYIERLNPVNWQNSPNITKGTPGYPAEKNAAYFVDAGVTYTNPTTNVFAGLAHLDNQIVAVSINAQDYGDFTVSGNQVTVPNYVPPAASFPPNIAHIGLRFTSTLQPQNLDLDVHTGVTKGIIKTVSGLIVDLFNTLACVATDGSTRKSVFKFRKTSGNLQAEPQLFAGPYEIDDFGGDYGLTIPIILSTSSTLPMTILAITPKYNNAGSPESG